MRPSRTRTRAFRNPCVAYCLLPKRDACECPTTLPRPACFETPVWCSWRHGMLQPSLLICPASSRLATWETGQPTSPVQPGLRVRCSPRQGERPHRPPSLASRLLLYLIWKRICRVEFASSWSLVHSYHCLPSCRQRGLSFTYVPDEVPEGE